MVIMNTGAKLFVTGFGLPSNPESMILIVKRREFNRINFAIGNEDKLKQIVKPHAGSVKEIPSFLRSDGAPIEYQELETK